MWRSVPGDGGVGFVEVEEEEGEGEGEVAPCAVAG